VLSEIPHKYWPEQRILLVVPTMTTANVWALDIRSNTVLFVDKETGDFFDGSYRIHIAKGVDDIVVPSETPNDLDFIFDHL
jgi:hypothetical protein